jgi:hypothetical protein
MPGEILLKMVSALTPDDIKQMKTGGSVEALKWLEDMGNILHLLEQMAASWHDGKYGVLSLSDVQLWAEVREKLKGLRATLNEG